MGVFWRTAGEKNEETQGKTMENHQLRCGTLMNFGTCLYFFPWKWRCWWDCYWTISGKKVGNPRKKEILTGHSWNWRRNCLAIQMFMDLTACNYHVEQLDITHKLATIHNKTQSSRNLPQPRVLHVFQRTSQPSKATAKLMQRCSCKWLQ